MDGVTQQIVRPSQDAHLAYFHDEIEVLEFAAAMLKASGFSKHQTSMRSEAVYYKYAGRKGVLRLSGHRFHNKKRTHGLDKVMSALTINFGSRPSWRVTDIENRVAMAIGYFFMRSIPDEERCNDL